MTAHEVLRGKAWRLLLVQLCSVATIALLWLFQDAYDPGAILGGLQIEKHEIMIILGLAAVGISLVMGMAIHCPRCLVPFSESSISTTAFLRKQPRIRFCPRCGKGLSERPRD